MRAMTMAVCVLAVGLTRYVAAQEAGGTNPAVVQDEARRWLQLQSARGETVSVETVSRTKTTGTLLDVAAESLSLGVAGAETRLERSRVRRITAERRDSVKNGLITGAVLGAGMAAASSCTAQNRKCGGRGRAAFIAVGAALWALIGEAIDSSIGKRVTLYEAPREPAKSTRGLSAKRPITISSLGVTVLPSARRVVRCRPVCVGPPIARSARLPQPFAKNTNGIGFGVVQS